MAVIRLALLALLLAACSHNPPACHGMVSQLNPGEWQASPQDLHQ